MNSTVLNTKFYIKLKQDLSKSTAQERKILARTIIEKDIDVISLYRLLNCEQKTTSRFLWLLSDIGTQNPKKLFFNLPILLKLCEQNNNDNHIKSFASFWYIVGVPPENEGKAIDLLFQWLISNDTNVTTKSRALFVLFKLTKKYPELKNELKLCLKDQMNKNTTDFEKRATKILTEIEK